MQGQQPAPQAGGVLPAGPVQPGGASDIMQIVQQLQQLPAYQQPYQQMSQIGQQEQGAASQLGQLSQPQNMPPTAYHPKYEPVTGGKSLLKDVGKGVLQALSLTGPGAAISKRVYAPGQQQYAQERSGLAEQVQALKGAEEAPAEQMRATTGMVQGAGLANYRSGMLGLGQQKVEVQKQNADTRAQAVANNYAAQGQKLQQGWSKLDKQQQDIDIKRWFDQGVLEAANARIAAGMDENSARVQAQEDMRSAVSQNQWSVQHPVLNALGMTPDIQAAQGAQPTKTAAPEKSAAGKVPKGTIVYDPQGKPHMSDGTQALPKGWSMKKAK
jgi:hypothetical protein